MQILKEAYLYSIQIYKNICGNGQNIRTLKKHKMRKIWDRVK